MKPLDHLAMVIGCGVVNGEMVPVTFTQKPNQEIKISAGSKISPQTFILPQPLQDLCMSTKGSLGTSVLVPRTFVLSKSLEDLQVAKASTKGAHVVGVDSILEMSIIKKENMPLGFSKET